MKERPILFSGEMVRAILEDRKTQTRRVVKPQFKGCDHKSFGPEVENIYNAPEHNYRQGSDDQFYCFACGEPFIPSGKKSDQMRNLISPYGVPGDRLWVRETFCRKCDGNDMPVWNADGNLDSSCFWFRASDPDIVNVEDSERSPWKPSIHMPRCASRITLEVDDVRIERLQDISEKDSRAEGVRLPERTCTMYDGIYRDAFRGLWDSINGTPRKDGVDISWAANPWVWVVSFKRIED